MPTWVLLELSSFGTVADVYRFCASHWDDAGTLDEHCMFKRVKDIRNACAHSAAVINDLGSTRPAPSELTAALRETGFSKRSRSSRMRNPRLQQTATLLLHSCMAEGTTLAEETSASLRALLNHDAKPPLSRATPNLVLFDVAPSVQVVILDGRAQMVEKSPQQFPPGHLGDGRPPSSIVQPSHT